VEEEVDETTMTAEVEVVVSALAAASFHRHPSTCPSLVTSEAEVVAAAEASMVVEVSSYPSAFAAESVVASAYQEATEEMPTAEVEVETSAVNLELAEHRRITDAVYPTGISDFARPTTVPQRFRAFLLSLPF